MFGNFVNHILFDQLIAHIHSDNTFQRYEQTVTVFPLVKSLSYDENNVSSEYSNSVPNHSYHQVILNDEKIVEFSNRKENE